MFCQYCGAQVANDARFCPSCGTPLASAAVQPQQGMPGNTGVMPGANQSQQGVEAVPDANLGQQQGASGAPTPPPSYSQQQSTQPYSQQQSAQRHLQQQFAQQQPYGQQGSGNAGFAPQQPYGQQQPGGPNGGQPPKRSLSPMTIIFIVVAAVAVVIILVVAFMLLAPNKGASSSAANQGSTQAVSQVAPTSGSSTAGSSAASPSGSATSSAKSASSTKGASSAKSASSPSSSSTGNSNQQAIDDAIAQGYQVFPGTLRIYSSKELATLQGMDGSMFPDGTVAVLMFDAPVQVSGMSSDGSGQRRESASMMGVAEHSEISASTIIDRGNLDSWRAYDGQHITIGVKADKVWFPSDVSLPVSEPRTGDAIVVG